MTSQTEIFQQLFLRRAACVQKLSTKTSEYHRLIQRHSGESVLHMKGVDTQQAETERSATEKEILDCQAEISELENQVSEIDQQISQISNEDN